MLLLLLLGWWRDLLILQPATPQPQLVGGGVDRHPHWQRRNQRRAAVGSSKHQIVIGVLLAQPQPAQPIAKLFFYLWGTRRRRWIRKGSEKFAET